MRRLTAQLLLGSLAAGLACAGPSVRPDMGAATSASASSPAAPMGLDAAVQSITAREMRAHIGFLASDALRGRDTPSPGLEVAAAYLASQFEAMGLAPAGEQGSYLQRYAFPITSLAEKDVRLELRTPQGRRALVFGRDFLADRGVPAIEGGGLVFVGTASESHTPSMGELRDQVAVALVPGGYGRPWRIATSRARRAARTAGAKAIIFVLAPEVTESDLGTLRRVWGGTRGTVGGITDISAFALRYEAARELFRAAKLDLDALRARDAQAAPVPLAGVTASLAAPAAMLAEASPPNVAAVLPGSDPALRDTYVVFSAHMDHVGVGQPDASGDSIYNGADDDASGTSSLLEVAQAFASLPTRPARSVLFLAVSGEEKGLLGSAYYADHPTVPLAKIVANINVDMIGRNAPDSIVVIGQQYSSLGDVVLDAARRHHGSVGLTVANDLWPQERFFFRSDHFNFARKEIPALFFFAGVHEDYHRPSDEVEKIDADKAARVARLVFLTGHAIASDPKAPAWTTEGLREVRALTR